MHRSISNNFTTHTRLGFQAQEMDDEIKGEGNSVNYKYRMHDPRLGRFFAVDPLASDYPYYSSYAFSGNRVIDCFELEGLEPSDYKSRLDGSLWQTPEYSGSSFQNDEQYVKKGKTIYSGLVTYDFVQFSVIENTVQSNSTPPSPNTNQGIGTIDTPGPGAVMEGLEEFAHKGQNVTKGTNGKFYDGWKGNQYVETAKYFNEDLLKPIAKNAPIIGNALDIWEVGEGFVKDGNTIGKNTIKESAGVVGGAGGAWAVGATFSAIGTAICPGIGTVIGGAVGAILGSWGGESGAEAIIEGIGGD